MMNRKMYHTYGNIIERFECQDYPHLVRQVFQYINGHWREKITDYIQKQKIDWAEILLQSTTLKIVDIAFLCGFEDTSYFGKIYKKQKGMTPMQVREKK